MYAWLYEGVIIVLHAVGSVPSDRIRWGYEFKRFAVEMLFGTFGILFKRHFPETKENEQARANFHYGLAFGVIFFLAVVNFIASYWEYFII